MVVFWAQVVDYMVVLFSGSFVGHNHLKGCWEYDVEWCPKYRFSALGKASIRQDCEVIFYQIAREKCWSILELAILPDPVHVILRCSKPENPSNILFYLKGRSSYELFKKHPNLRLRYPKGHLWSRGSFIRNIGADINTQRRYVREQRDIHQKSLTQFN